MLTEDEKRLAMQSCFFSYIHTHDEDGFATPETLVAASRGANFYTASFFHGASRIFLSPDEQSIHIFSDTVKDFVKWFGLDGPEQFYAFQDDQGPFMWDRVRTDIQ